MAQIPTGPSSPPTPAARAAGVRVTGVVGLTGPTCLFSTGPEGPDTPGIDIDQISLKEVIRDGDIIVRYNQGQFFSLRFQHRFFSSGVASYGLNGWRFHSGENGAPLPILLARAVLLETPQDVKLFQNAEAIALPIWQVIISRIEDLWRVTDVMMT